MNNKIKKILLITLLFTICFAIDSGAVSASGSAVGKKTSNRLQALAKEMQDFEYFLLMQNGYGNKYSKKSSIKLNNEYIAKASALSIPVSEKNCVKKEELSEGEDYYYSVSDSAIKNASKNIFGKTVDKTSMPSEKIENCIYDAYNSPEYGPVKYECVVETETTYTINIVSVTKKGSEYIMVKDAYFGYWGGDHGNSNVRITYTAKKSGKSKYGYVIKKMSIQKYDKTISFSVDQYAQIPFYGIWCDASKSLKQAGKKAMNLYKKGFEAEIVVTSDWSNLNKEKWYVITYGEYGDEESAKENLTRVKKYYPKAYVKYTGERRS